MYILTETYALRYQLKYYQYKHTLNIPLVRVVGNHSFKMKNLFTVTSLVEIDFICDFFLKSRYPLLYLIYDIKTTHYFRSAKLKQIKNKK